METNYTKELAKNERALYISTNKKEEVAEEPAMGVTVGSNHNNVVIEPVLRKVQKQTLREAKEYLATTFGPMGSNTKIITGNNRQNITTSYSKDGLKVLKSLANSGPIEASIVEELIEITSHVEHEVGDGTTSTVILASIIFEKILELNAKYNIPPYKMMRMFDKQVQNIKDKIKESSKPCTVDDIYDISMISTNGNEDLSSDIKEIYEKYGMDVDLSVSISNTSDTAVKLYDGLTITEGMAGPVYINNTKDNICEIHNAHIYHFVDPIDTLDQIALLNSILQHNIYEPLQMNEEPIPTVITCPRYSKDLSSLLRELENTLYRYNATHNETAKPPILVITNVIASDELIMNDISNLCGCKDLKKYIDPAIYQKDIESGLAATPDNAFEFYGEAELVVAGTSKTKFINPKHMYTTDENGERVEDPIYTAMVGYLETEINLTDATENTSTRGLLRKRLSALKANMAEFFVGGVTTADKEATKDLAEDAVKNCKSAALYGVGYAANFDALRFSLQNIKDNLGHNVNDKDYSVNLDIARCIFNAYFDVAQILYGTVSGDKDDIDAHIYQSLVDNKPYDISSGELPTLSDTSDKVKCSVMLDIHILDTLSKIITKMGTCKQLMLQDPSLNIYH